MCCIGKYEAEPLIEFYSGSDKSINTKGFANITIENKGTVDAFLMANKVKLETGEVECFAMAELPMNVNIPLSWSASANKLNAVLKVKKYKLIELCQ